MLRDGEFGPHLTVGEREGGRKSAEVWGVVDFGEKILWLLDHPEERERMGQFGRRRIEKELAWEYSVRNLLAAYEKAFSKVRGKHAFQADSART